MSNSAFRGPTHTIARVNWTGSVVFESCLFNVWAPGRYTIEAASGDLVVRGSDFQHVGGQVLLSGTVYKVVFTGNIVAAS